MKSNNLRKSVLGDFCSFKYGKTIRKSEIFSNGLFPVFSGYQIVGYLDSFMYEDSQLLVVCRGVGGTGDIKLSPEKCSITNLSIVISPDEKIDKKYLYWLLRNSDTYSLRTGSAQPQITIADLERFSVEYHGSILHQKAIAHILGTLDERVELNKKTNETLEEIAKALFKSWFIDFDPVRAKAEGRSTGLPHEINELFPDSFENSELGEIPRGWTVSEIGNVVECLGGGTPSTKETAFWENGTNFWATPKDLSSLAEPFLLDTAKKITIAGVRKISSGVLPIGTVLLSSRAPVGYVAVARVPVSVNQGFIALKPSGTVSTEYLLNWTLANVQQFKDRASGTTFAEISKKSFRPIPILIPKEEVLRNFTSQTSSIYERVVSSMKETAILISLRNALLPKLISGDLRVPDAEKMLEEVGL